MIEELQIFDFITSMFRITLAAAVIFAFLTLFTKLIKYFFGRITSKDLVLNILLILKTLIWLTFGVWSVKVLISLPLFGNIFFLLVISSIFLTILWVMGRDIIYGFILRIENAMDINKRIRTRNIDGRITKLGLRTITIESDNAERFQIPFSKLFSEKIRCLRDEDRFKSFETEIKTRGNINPEKVKDIIFKSIIYSPYSSIGRPPIINYIGEENNQNRFKLIMFTLNEDYFNRLIFTVHNKLNINDV